MSSDIYELPTARSTSRPSQRQGDYRARIHKMSENGYPNLRNLSDFMFAKTHIIGLGTSAKCTILNFTESKKPPTVLRAESDGFEELLGSLQEARGHSRMLIVLEDLSSDLIEEIGGQLSIDPHFFASHLRTAEWQREDKFTNPSRLPSSQKSDDFVCLRYLEPIILNKHFSYRSHAELRDGNLPRNIEFRNPKSFSSRDQPDKSVAIISRSTSYWSRTYENGCWEAVLLTDRRLLSGFSMMVSTPFKGSEVQNIHNWTPFGHGIVDFTPWPENFKDHIWPVREQKRSLLDELLYYWKQPWMYDFNEEPHMQTYYLLQKIVQSKWMVISTYLCEDFNSLELQNLSGDKPQIQVIGNILDELMSSRNLLVKCCLLVKRTLVELGIEPTEERYFSKRQDSFGPSNFERSSNSQPSTVTASACKNDWTFILRELQAWQEDTKELLNTHMMSLQFLDSNRALADSRSQHSESRNVNRLTFLGAVFIPLSFTASLLSMGDDYIPGSGPRFWIFWSIAVPLTVAIIAAIWIAQRIDHPPARTPPSESSERSVDQPEKHKGWFLRRRRGQMDMELLFHGPEMPKAYELSHQPAMPAVNRMTID